jgi:hypothetical protein
LSAWPGASVQVCLLDGNTFDQKCAGEGAGVEVPALMMQESTPAVCSLIGAAGEVEKM